MRKPSLALISVLLCALFSFSPLSAQPDSPQNQHVWAFYLSFWAGENTWDWNASILQDYPLIGRYNSKMPHIAATHIQQAQSAGIDAFVVNWWGIDETVTSTPALDNLLDRAAEQGFAIAAAVDMFPEAFNRDVDGVIQSLRWLIDERSDHPGYLHYDGKPVIVFAFQYMADFNTATWHDIREAVDPDRETLWLAEGLSACCLHNGVMDGMYAFNMAWSNGVADFYIAERNIVFERGGALYLPSVSPGWDEDAIAEIQDRPNPTSIRSREDGEFLRAAWQAALETESDVVMIVSWNEFIENSHIEPSELYGTESLDLLRDLISEWRGTTPPDLPPLPESYAVTVTAPTDAYAQPDATGATIRTLQPDTRYRIVDEDNGLYGVEAGDSVVYVPALLVETVPLLD